MGVREFCYRVRFERSDGEEEKGIGLGEREEERERGEFIFFSRFVFFDFESF